MRGVKEKLNPGVYNLSKLVVNEQRRTFCIMGQRVSGCGLLKPLGVCQVKTSVIYAQQLVTFT